jgi:hypothetical protein
MTFPETSSALNCGMIGSSRSIMLSAIPTSQRRWMFGPMNWTARMRWRSNEYSSLVKRAIQAVNAMGVITQPT